MTTSIDMHVPASGAGETLEIRAEAVGPESSTNRPESELRAAARRRGLTMKELAAKMGVSVGYVSGIASGRNPWTPRMRAKAALVLGEVPRQGVVYRQGGVVSGESCYIRERARELGLRSSERLSRTARGADPSLTCGRVIEILTMTFPQQIYVWWSFLVPIFNGY